MTIYTKIVFVVCTTMFAVSCLTFVTFVLMVAAGVWKPTSIWDTLVLLVVMFLLIVFTFVFMMLAANRSKEPKSAIAQQGTVVYEAKHDPPLTQNMFPHNHPQA